jgi:hypothetical protein
LCRDTWAIELQGDPDETFILDGLTNGFAVIDTDSQIPINTVEVDNYTSATCFKNIGKVEAQIREELAEGNYSIVHDKPLITSALGAIPKADSGIRLIHDASRPEGGSLNDLASRETCKFQSFKDVLDIITPNGYCATVDLKSAYRSCGIRESDKVLTGLKWKFTGTDYCIYMQDNRLPFGSRKSVYHFHRITQSIKRMMQKRGFNIVVFMDDFLLAERDFKTCLASYNTLISLLRSLGFSINWKKVVDPTQALVYLGIHLDTYNGVLSLDLEKRATLLALLQRTMYTKRLSKTQLQSLAGKLAWASIVTPWGKTHTCIFFKCLSLLNKPSHKVPTERLHSGIQWWIECLSGGNNNRLIWDNRRLICMSCDASEPNGGGFCYENGDWVFKNWRVDVPHLAKAHINIKELYMGCEAIARWAPVFPNSRMCLFMDSLVSTFMINKGRSHNIQAVKCLQWLSLVSMKYNVAKEAFFIPGEMNEIADSISRFHMNGQIARFMSLIYMGQWPAPQHNGYWLRNHMSKNAELCICSQISKWKALYMNWTVKLQAGDRRPWQDRQNGAINATHEPS